jgi:hypothetical protein
MQIKYSRRSVLGTALSAGAAAKMNLGSAADAEEVSRLRAGQGIEPARYFDLPYRAGLAINCLTRLLDESQDYLPYFDARYDAKPPVAIHIRWDYGDAVGRYTDAIKLARIMSGNTDNLDRDAALQRWAERLLGEDGLSWWPNSPYKSPFPAGQPGHVADVTWTQRSTIVGLTTQYLATGDKHYADLAKGVIDGLNKLVLWEDGMAYFPREATDFRSGDVLYTENGWSTRTMLRAGWFGAILGALIWPLARFAAITGYEPAVRLARGIAEFALHGARLYRPDGRFCDLIQGHFYARTTTAGGLVRLGLLTGNKEYVQMGERVYNHAKEWGTSYGWFPEDLMTMGCETCCIKDMIELAIDLALHVDPRYWNDVERFGRNHLLEAQLLRIDWMNSYNRPQPFTIEDSDRTTRDHVMERWLGGFAGWSGHNDWVCVRGMMACCNASGARALYDLWHYGVTRDSDGTSVNLLLSRATDDVIVKSWLPFSGRVDIEIRTDRAVRVRVPDYVDHQSLEVRINDRLSAVEADKAWVRLPHAKRGDMVSMRFALPERSESVYMGYSTYEVAYRGDTVTTIVPPGKVYPLYQRTWAAQLAPTLPPPNLAHGMEIDSI